MTAFSIARICPPHAPAAVVLQSPLTHPGAHTSPAPGAYPPDRLLSSPHPMRFSVLLQAYLTLSFCSSTSQVLRSCTVPFWAGLMLMLDRTSPSITPAVFISRARQALRIGLLRTHTIPPTAATQMRLWRT